MITKVKAVSTTRWEPLLFNPKIRFYIVPFSVPVASASVAGSAAAVVVTSTPTVAPASASATATVTTLYFSGDHIFSEKLIPLAV